MCDINLVSKATTPVLPAASPAVDGARRARGLALSLVTAALVASPAAVTPAPAEVAPDKLLVVDCMLPAQERTLGGRMHYLGPRRAVRSTAIDCEIRGGEYVSYDRADYATSLRVWMPLAEHGDAQAQIYVGEIYEKGLGTAPDYSQAAAWYDKAAAQGNVQGLNHSAYMYEQGLGVPKDPVHALNLYRAAAGLKDDQLTFVSEVTAVREEAQTKIDALSQQLDERNRTTQAQADSLDETRHQLAEQQTFAARAAAESAQLRKQIASLQSPAPTVADRQEIDRLKSALTDRENKLSEERAEISKLEHASSEQDDALRGRLSEAEHEDALLRQQLGAAQAQAANDRSQLAATQARAKAVDQEVQDLRTQMKASETALASAQEQLRRKANAQDEAGRTQGDTLKSKVAEQQIQLERQKTVIASLDDQRQKLDVEIHRLESVVASAQTQAANDHTQLAADQAKAKAVDQEMRDLRSQMKASEAALASAQEQLRRKPSQDDASRTQSDTLKSKVAEQQLQLDHQKTVIASLDDQRQKLDTEIHHLESAIAGSQAQSAKDRETHEQDSATAASLRAQLASAQSEVIRKTVELKDLAAKLDADEHQIAEDKRVLNATVASAGSKDAEVQRLNAALATHEANLAGQKAQLAALQVTVSNDRRTIDGYKSLLSKNEPATREGPKLGENGPPETVKPAELGLGQNFALIIGNADYAYLPHLKTAVKDAQDVQQVLSDRYGFKGHTRLLINATRSQMMNALNDLTKLVGERDSVVIYYAGHGALEEKKLQGFWLPIDAERENPTNWVSDQNITEMISLMTARHILIVADSCYSGAMLRTTNFRLMSAPTTIAREKRIILLAKLRSRTVLTSGGNEPVLDSGPDGHSIFAREFIDVLNSNTHIMEAAALYTNVSDRVFATEKRVGALSGTTINQTPRYSVLADAGHLNGEFLFVPMTGTGSPTG